MGALRAEVRCVSVQKCITNTVMCYSDAMAVFCVFSSSQLDPGVPELSV